MALYDSIGCSYSTTRRPDPRIAAQIRRVVGAGRVINIGAGAGAYEPAGTELAIEPSAAMIAQRPSDAALCLQASAEEIPAVDGAFDVALAILTVHHWTDIDSGLAEMRRVARRQIVLTWDAAVFGEFWLMRDYLPESAAWDSGRCPDLEQLVGALGGEVETVPIAHDCTDGFAGAYWRRPHAYLNPDVRACISLFAERPGLAAPGLARLAADLETGAWYTRNSSIVELDTIDVGYRLISN